MPPSGEPPPSSGTGRTGRDAAVDSVLATYFGIDAAAAASLADELETRTIAGGAWLFRQGEAGDSLFLVVRGRLQVWREGNAERPPQLVGEVTPGESVGEVALLTGEERSASVRAIRDATLVELDRTHFERLARTHPELLLGVASLVARRLHERTIGAGGPARPPKVIALQPLAADAPTEAACRRLADALGEVFENARGEARGKAPGDAAAVLDLSPDTLATHGAPPLASADAALGEGLRHWIADAEAARELVLLRCTAARSPWSDFARRQADLVVFVAQADGDAGLVEADLDEQDGEDAAASHAMTRRALLLLHGPGRVPSGTGRWRSRRRLDFHLHLRADHETRDLARIARVLAGRATGLVLGGGAARGFAHLGIHRALVECGVPIDWIGGTSIGAIIGANLAKDRSPEETIERARAAFVDGRPFDDYTIPLVSLLRGTRMVALSKEHLDGEIEDLPLPFFCVSSNMNSGLVNVHERGPIWRAVAASAALPGVLPPVVHEGELAVDGAVLNNLPVDVMRERPVGRVIAVELSARETHRVDYEDLPSPWALLGQRLLPGARRVDVPGLARVLLLSTGIGSRARVEELAAQADVLLRPPVREFGLLSVRQFDAVVDAGYRYGLEQLAALEGR